MQPTCCLFSYAFLIDLFVAMANNNYCDRSSDIRECLDESVSEGDITEDEGNSDIEAEDVPDDISLEDYSSGSGEEYNPDYDDIDSSELESSDEDDGQVRNIPIPNIINPPIPLPPPPAKKAWVRVNPPEPASNVEASFRVRSGVKNLPPRNSNPIDYFYLFFTNAVFDFITRQTNYYANKKIAASRASGQMRPFSRLKKWVDITVQDMKCFFALLINMGLTKRKNLAAYWDTRPSQIIEFYHKTMTYNKFQSINSNLHLTLATTLRRGDRNYDPWTKVRYLLDHLNKSFKMYFVPYQNVCIDESVIGMKNRCSFIQYMPNKKHARYGIKKFVVCDSLTSFISHIELYSGTDFLQGNPFPFTQKVIFDIMQKANLLDKHYHLFTDNFYTKIPLAEKLVDRNTYITGTINRNSKFLCKQALQEKLEARQTIYFRKDQVLLVGFKQAASRKPVFVISTASHAEDGNVRSKKGLVGLKPLLIHKYNQYMGGVDNSDKSIYHTSCSRSTQKYWKKLFLNFVDMALFNSFILYKNNTDRPMNRKDFIVNIVDELSEYARAARPMLAPVQNIAPGHVIERLPNRRERLCIVCGPTQKRGRSSYWCPGCNCGVHQLCFPYLEHFWRPTQKGRKRKASSSSSD